MRRRSAHLLGALAAVLAGGCSRSAAPEVTLPPAPADPDLDPQQLFSPRASLLILGTFHFANLGLDSHKSERPNDIASEHRQAELGEVLDRLEAFAPTKIAVELPPRLRSLLDARYDEYRVSHQMPGINEIYQLGFALADRLDHARLHPIDAQGRRYRPYLSASRAAKRWGQQSRVSPELAARYEQYYDWQDALYSEMSIGDYLVFLNAPKNVMLSHGAYVSGEIAVHNERRYPSADHVTGWWYNRNLRIFANVMSLVEEPDERILLVIGAGHVPILRHAALASPELELVEVDQVLGSSSSPRDAETPASPPAETPASPLAETPASPS